MVKTGFFIALFWLLLTSAYAQTSLPITPFSASYAVYGKGMALGNGEITLIDEGSGRYRMQSRLNPEGLAALLISGNISEDVNGVFTDGVPLPDVYRQQFGSGKKARSVDLRFDWQNAQVAASYQEGKKQQQATLAISAGAVDPLSLHLLVMYNLQRGQRPELFTMINKTESRQYRVQYNDGEMLQTPLGKLPHDC